MRDKSKEMERKKELNPEVPFFPPFILFSILLSCWARYPLLLDSFLVLFDSLFTPEGESRLCIQYSSNE